MLFSYKVSRDGVLTREWVLFSDPRLEELFSRVNTFESWAEYVCDEDLPLLEERRRRLFSGQPAIDRIRLKTPGGTRLVQLTGRPEMRFGRCVRLVGSAQDMTESVRSSAEQQRAKEEDGLTGLATYPAFQSRLGAEIERCRETQRPIGVLYLSLGIYSDIASSFGFPAADTAVVEAAERLEAAFPPNAFLARIHTDRFVAFVPNTTGVGAEDIARRLMPMLNAPQRVSGVEIDLDARVGLACFPAHGDIARHLIRKANMAAEAARADNRSWHVFESDQEDRVSRNLGLMHELREALSLDSGLFLVYQPQYDLQDGSIASAEALLRWSHPTLGQVLPGWFLPQVERTRLVHPLFKWTLNSALRQVRAWRDQGREINVGVNLSGRNLDDPNLVATVESALRESDVPPSALKLEVTETALVDSHGGRSALQALSERAIIISMDDFGTGYSSLSYLRSLPITELKLDKAFVSDIHTNGANHKLARMVVDIARVFNLTTVAEGVETREGAEAVKEIGFDRGQGYYYGRPRPARDFEAFFSREAHRYPSSAR